MKYPTSDLIFLRIQRKCVYKEKSSHEWDISRYTTRKHYITNISHATLTHLSFLHRFRFFFFCSLINSSTSLSVLHCSISFSSSTCGYKNSKSRLKLGFSSSIFKLFTLKSASPVKMAQLLTFGGKIWRPEERWDFFVNATRCIPQNMQ